MPKDRTIVEQYDGLMMSMREAMFAPSQVEAVDWTKVKSLLGQFLQAFGPILLQLLITSFTKNDPPAS